MNSKQEFSDDIAKRANLVYIDDDQYKKMLEDLNNLNLVDKDNSDFSFAIGFNLQGIPYIFCHNELLEYPEEYKNIIVAHEAAHAIGMIENEEEADRWALDGLKKEEQEILKGMWKDRHGHKYKE